MSLRHDRGVSGLGGPGLPPGRSPDLGGLRAQSGAAVVRRGEAVRPRRRAARLRQPQRQGRSRALRTPRVTNAHQREPRRRLPPTTRVITACSCRASSPAACSARRSSADGAAGTWCTCPAEPSPPAGRTGRTTGRAIPSARAPGLRGAAAGRRRRGGALSSRACSRSSNMYDGTGPHCVWLLSMSVALARLFAGAPPSCSSVARRSLYDGCMGRLPPPRGGLPRAHIACSDGCMAASKCPYASSPRSWRISSRNSGLYVSVHFIFSFVRRVYSADAARSRVVQGLVRGCSTVRHLRPASSAGSSPSTSARAAGSSACPSASPEIAPSELLRPVPWQLLFRNPD